LKKENDELKHENLKLENSIATFKSSLTHLVKAEVKSALQQASKSNETLEILTLKESD
jgi:cell division protein FtsB